MTDRGLDELQHTRARCTMYAQKLVVLCRACPQAAEAWERLGLELLDPEETQRMFDELFGAVE